MTQINPEVSVEPTHVTDADRLAAAEHHGFKSWRELKAWGCRESHMMLAEAFARHRLAHQTPPATQPSATVGEVEEALRHASNLLMKLIEVTKYRTVMPAAPLGRDMLATAERLAALATLHTPPPVATASVVDETHREFLEGVEGVVEADSYATHMLWREYAEQAAKFALSDKSQRYKWEQGSFGYGAKVGEIGGRPVWISILCNVVNGQKLLFWHVTSPAADYDLCDAWLRAHLPASAFRADGYINRTDPMNFSNILRSATPTPTAGER